ncbi:MAG: ABC transporter permease [Propionibacteriaceae bacterium]|jgi:ABC-2 type transport system permease protein|nr:ABC transporter permease [Propionibacteriaceae bacterium]
MRNTLAQAKRVWQQFGHDPRTVAMFIVAPVLILWLFSAMLGTTPGEPKLAAQGLADPVVTALDAVAEVQVMSSADAEAALASRDIDAIVTSDGTTLTVKVEGTNASTTGRTLAAIQSGLKTLAAAGPNAAPTSVDVTYLHGSAAWTSFDYLGPVFIGIFIFVFVFITAGMSFVTERTGGTMERLMVTPIKSWQLVAGYCLGFGVVTVVQAAIVLACSIWLIGFPNEGNLGLVILTTFSMAMVSMTLGLLVSGLARTAFQVIQLMILLVVPQILLSGIFDLTNAPAWMRVLSVCFPISHGADALRSIMLRGDGLGAVGGNLAILWGFIVVFFALATLSFRTRRTR